MMLLILGPPERIHVPGIRSVPDAMRAARSPAVASSEASIRCCFFDVRTFFLRRMSSRLFLV